MKPIMFSYTNDVLNIKRDDNHLQVRLQKFGLRHDFGSNGKCIEYNGDIIWKKYNDSEVLMLHFDTMSRSFGCDNVIRLETIHDPFSVHVFLNEKEIEASGDPETLQLLSQGKALVPECRKVRWWEQFVQLN